MNQKIFNSIFISSSLSVLSILIGSIVFPKWFFNTLTWIKATFVLNISWFYTLTIFCLFCFCLYLVFSSYGRIRLGSTSKPRYNTFTWIAMLFSAGMGTGLLFSGVYEPLHHYLFPPLGKGSTPESMDLSFQLTFLHWGFSGWVVYTCVGLIVAYFCFQKKLPFRISSILHPFLKDKIHGPIGVIIDTVSITAILFGIATSLGRGTMQINSGLKHLFQLPFSEWSQGCIIITITIIATFSVLSGLNRGIRRLSEMNMILCLFLLIFMLFSGPTIFLLNSFVEYTGLYLQNLVTYMTRIQSLGPTDWRSKWTILYWAWWIAWAPFVGLFIARISEGRTVREFIIGCLVAPTVLSFIWFTVFGGTAIHYHIENLMNLEPFVKTEYSILAFKFLEHFPFAKVTTLITLITVAIFFITSSDSASYVIHRMSSTQKNPAKIGKIYWSFIEGLLALMLVFSGGIQSLELLVIITAFPFTILICLMVYGFFKELQLLKK